MITEKAFSLTYKNNLISIKHLTKYNGLPCSIYFPIGKPRIYNDSSQSYEYKSVPDVEGRFLVTGIFERRELTGLGLEGYSSFSDGDAKIYTISDPIEIPRNSKVIVHFENGKKRYRTQDTFIVNGLNGIPLFGIHKLVPMV